MNRSCSRQRVRYSFSGVLFLLLAASLQSKIGHAQEIGDFSLSYGYSYLSGARRPNLLPEYQKLPGSFTFWLQPLVSIHVSSDTYKWRHFGTSRTNGPGDTRLG